MEMMITYGEFERIWNMVASETDKAVPVLN
jgi:hypothetical protein